MILPLFMSAAPNSAAKGKDSDAKGMDSASKGKGPADTVPDAQDAAREPNLTRLVLGLRFDGSGAFDYFRPSILRFAAALADVEDSPASSAVKWESCVPLPAGMRMHRRPSDNMPPLSMADKHTIRFRRVFGYVGEIKLIKDLPSGAIDFDSPAMLAIIAKVWWRYGPHKAETRDRWAWRRLLTGRILLFAIPPP